MPVSSLIVARLGHACPSGLACHEMAISTRKARAPSRADAAAIGTRLNLPIAAVDNVDRVRRETVGADPGQNVGVEPRSVAPDHLFDRGAEQASRRELDQEFAQYPRTEPMWSRHSAREPNLGKVRPLRFAA